MQRTVDTAAIYLFDPAFRELSKKIDHQKTCGNRDRCKTPLTPPSTPHRHQERRRQNQRDIREAEDGSPRRRRVPLIPHTRDENEPPTATTGGASARSLGQLRRYQGQRANPPPEIDPSRSLVQQARRARERAEKEMQMDIDGTCAFALKSMFVLASLSPQTLPRPPASGFPYHDCRCGRYPPSLPELCR
ncbi:hypothetical protein DFH09DRAFT_1099706 [Mycena vulgaris]|nr:hypothetical protein DFH09DRAFT_1099706 [Mycena vulgaris]